MDLVNDSTKIRNLSPHSFNEIVTGIILYRSPNKSSKTLNLLLRDSKDYTINCVIWGSPSHIIEWWNKCEVGKVVTITCVRVTHSLNDYLPTSISPFLITATEMSQFVFQKDDRLREFLFLPLKPVEGALTLDDIKVNGEKGIGQNVDVFVLIREVKAIRTIRTTKKDAKEEIKNLRELVICDRSNPGMLLTIWSEDIIERSNEWQSLNKVLHIVDVKIGYSSFYKSIFLMTTSKTVVTESPSHERTQDLLEMGLQMDQFDSTFSRFGGNALVARPEGITEVMTCQRIIDRMTSKGGIGDEDQFTGVIYAILTKFNLDNERGVIKKKW